jgi:hypothetical protein
MKKKGQIENMGMLIIIFIVAIVGITFFIQIARDVGTSTSTVSVANESLGTVLNNSVIYLTSYQSIDDVVIYNATTSVVADTEYSVENKVVYNGALAIKVTVDADDSDGETGNEWFISGTAEPQGYMSGATAQMALLIPLMFVLAILLVLLMPIMKDKLLN